MVGEILDILQLIYLFEFLLTVLPANSPLSLFMFDCVCTSETACLCVSICVTLCLTHQIHHTRTCYAVVWGDQTCHDSTGCACFQKTLRCHPVPKPPGW